MLTINSFIFYFFLVYFALRGVSGRIRDNAHQVHLDVEDVIGFG